MPPIPDVMTTSPGLTVVSRLTKSRVSSPSMEPRTIPAARVDWTIAATPLRWSVMSRTRDVWSVTSVVLPEKARAAGDRHPRLDAVGRAPVDRDEALPTSPSAGR